MADDYEVAEDDPVVDLDETESEEEKPKGFTYDEDSPNLVEDFLAHDIGKDALKEIAKTVTDDFDDDFENTEEFRQRMADNWRLVTGDLPKKTFPFPDAANAHIPIVLENIGRVTMRAFDELFGDWSNVFGVVPMGPDDQEQASILTAHGNWQIREQIIDFRRQMHRFLFAYFMIGDVTIRSYWDEKRRLNAHEVLTPDEFVTPFHHITTRPDYSDLPHYTVILHRYRNELESMRQSWAQIDKVLDDKHEPSHYDDPEQLMAETMAEVQGTERSDKQKGPYKLLQYEGWMDLPNQTEQRFVQVILEYRTKTVLLLRIHEQPNWQDKQRYERQSGELEQYRMAEASYREALVMHQQMQQDLASKHAALMSGVDEGQMGPVQATVAAQSLGQENQMMPPPPIPPTPPDWLSNPEDPEAKPEPVRKEPIRLNTHAVLIEPLVGSLGLSYGRIEADFNRAANTVLSQFIDAATLSNVWSILAPESFSVVGGDSTLTFSPGKINRISGMSSAEIKDAIIPLKPAPPSADLVTILRMMTEFGQSSIQAPNVLSGEPGKSGETYRGLSARIEQASKPLSVVTRKAADCVEQILKNNAALNAIFLPDDEIVQIADHTLGMMRKLPVSRRLYERTYSVEIRADLRFASTAQRIAESDEVVQMSISHPMLAQNPLFQWHALKKAFEARGRHDLIQVLGPPPQPMMPPPMQGPPGPMPGAPNGKPTMAQEEAPPEMMQ